MSIFSKLGRLTMAPQRQKRKLRLSRMDAAIDAMLPYGFAESDVQKVVKLLLKEYGGNEGWPFIEEFSYNVLIEAILRDLEPCEKMTAAKRGNPSQRLSRMDAAIDAMLPYGFSECHVQEVATLLLKEYGGNEGWPFIEEFSYKVLIEAILRDLEPCDETTAAERGNQSQIGSKNENPARASATTERNTLQGVGLPNPTSQEVGRNKTGTDLGQASRQNEREITHAATENDGQTATAHLGQSSTPDSASRDPPSLSMNELRRLPGYSWIQSDEEDPEELEDT